ncbi:MAG: ATP-dependent nuclease [Pseudoramibacter sp.]
MITKLLVKNFKILKDVEIELNPKINIFVGDNDTGKSTLLEALSIATTGRLHYYPFNKQIKANLFNNSVRKDYIDAVHRGETPEPPKIIIEVYLDDSSDQQIKGNNNELREDSSGIRTVVEIDKRYFKVYKKMLDDNIIFDIPVELYKVTYSYFSGDNVIFRFSPVKSVFIDATHKNYSYTINKFVNSSIENILSNEEQVELSREYRQNRNNFRNNDYVKKLNKIVSDKNEYGKRKVSVDLKEELIDAWKQEMNLVVDDVPFENVGFGTQNTIKEELVLKSSSNNINIVLLEEPENNLSYSNMSRLIDNIESTNEKQVFISTHSSYVANKLDLHNLFLVNEGKTKPFSSLKKEVVDYFVRLPGYDTLRILLAKKVILVEGPTDELILQRAYFDSYGKLPIQDEVDIIVVDSLAFKQYCEIAILINKKISIVTDNDHSIENLKNKYKEYINNPLINFYYETDEKLNTIEPSVLNVNCKNGLPSMEFQNIVNHRNKKEQMTFDELNKFMQNNKSLWAMRVFQADECINYPEYIKNAVRQFN